MPAPPNPDSASPHRDGKNTVRHPLPRAIVQTFNELEPSGSNDDTNMHTTKMSVNKRLALLAECIASNYDIC